MIVSQSKTSYWHILSICVLSVYALELLHRIITDKDKITTRIINSFKKTTGRDYIYFFLIIGMLAGDLTFNKYLTPNEIHDIKVAIKLAILAGITALFAHLDAYVVPGILAIAISFFIV